MCIRDSFIPMPLSRYSVHVVPIPLRVTGVPFRRRRRSDVLHVTFGTGIGGSGLGADPPHHCAFPAESQAPRHCEADMQNGFVLQRPQSHAALQL